MHTYFVKSHAYNPKTEDWHGLTSCTTAESAPKAVATVIRHLKESGYSRVVILEVD